MFLGSPQLVSLVPLFLAIVGFQAFNSFVRFGQPTLTMIGVGFYLAPLIGLWMGYQLGLSPPTLRGFVGLYLLFSVPWSFTVWLSHQGVQWGKLLSEVGGGILINFSTDTGSISQAGASGLWRTSELAAMHLAAAACLALVYGWSSPSRSTSNIFGLGALFCTFLTLLTGRRKALVLVVAFVLIMLLFQILRGDVRMRDRILTGVLGPIGIGVLGVVALFPNLLVDLNPFLWRASTIPGELWQRFWNVGFNAIWPAIENSQIIGLGAGALAQTGQLGINVSGQVANPWVSESGVGKLITELGLPGVVVLLLILVQFGRLLVRNAVLLRSFDPSSSNLYLGLLAFSLANVPFFIAASGVYGDPFVLILVGLSLGAFLALPTYVYTHTVEQINQSSSAELEPNSGSIASVS
ncbi:hypothetical protein [Synechococcus sp. 1G10]|uniref:hypothetical protein n=1 Tax=Synechococcus sp. 1G10 TaxID=2025605 RepID=UPI00117FCF06|nr:hypothetical protein [Synechococcus sp. 1G10]